MPQKLFSYGTPRPDVQPVQTGDQLYLDNDTIEFVIGKGAKKAVETAAEFALRKVGIVGSVVAESLFSGSPLNGGEEAALAAEDAKLLARQAALAAAQSPLVSPVGESDP